MTGATTQVSKIVNAPREMAYCAFVDPAALVAWLPPGERTGEMHAFDPTEGGGFRMSLVYPASEKENRGKTTEKTDTFTARFVELSPFERIVQMVNFESDDPAFAGEMTMVMTFTEAEGGTDVSITCQNIPPGIRLEDNEAGCRLSLEQLARWLEQDNDR